MSGGSGNLQAILASGFEIRRTNKPSDHRGACGVNGRFLVSAAGSKLKAGAPMRGGDHAGSRCCHCGVMVKDRKDDGL